MSKNIRRSSGEPAGEGNKSSAAADNRNNVLIGAEETNNLSRAKPNRLFSNLKTNWKIFGVILLLPLVVLGWKYLETTSDKNVNNPAAPQAFPGSSQTGMNSPNLTATNTSLHISKDYIYSGSRMVAVEEPGASMQPPSDLAVWRPASGTWYVMDANGGIQAAAQWGIGTDTPTPGDFDGDGKTDFAVYRATAGAQSVWYVLRSSDSSLGAYYFGIDSDKPAPADFDGDGQTDVAVWRPAEGIWYILPSTTQQYYALQFGTNGDKPIPADYDGDGRADLAVWRTSDTTWYIWHSSNGSYRFEPFGAAADKLVIGDYNGDGRFDIGVWQSDSVWRIKMTGSGALRQVQWGIQSSDIAVPGDYDGDGETDIAVWRPSTGYWWIQKSASNYQTRAAQWGQDGDVPVPAPYRRTN